jgi:pyruvate dehydrogenase E1 component alpha subunit
MSSEPSDEMFRVLADDGRADPAIDPMLDPELLRRMYREMLRARMLDERLVALHRQGRIGFYSASTGQEAAPVAAGLALGPRDWVFPALREGALMLVRGFPLTAYIAQVYGNIADVLKGRQMPSHMSGRSVNHVSWSTVIGSQLPHAVGAAWAARLKGDDTVVLGFLGDGATSSPDFHAAMNMAGVFSVPVVFVCQNNQLAVSMPVSRQTASVTLAAKAQAYGIASRRVDGNDVIAVYAVLAEAIANARRGTGPTFIELFTYRIAPHSTSDDPSRYRSEDEVDAWKAKDPVSRLRQYLGASEILGEREDADMRKAIDEEIGQAITEVEAMGPNDVASLFDDVYEKLPWHLVEQRELLARILGGRSGTRDG